jgi:hypothetical protein
MSCLLCSSIIALQMPDHVDGVVATTAALDRMSTQLLQSCMLHPVRLHKHLRHCVALCISWCRVTLAGMRMLPVASYSMRVCN